MKSKLNNIHSKIITCSLMCILFSCKTQVKSVQVPPTPEIIKTQHEGFTKVLVIKHNVDGCSWMLKQEDGKLLEPVNLNEDLKKENLILWIKFKHYENYSFCMSGEMVTIISFEKDE